MLSEIHVILTYACNFECDHCFLFCSPRAQGTFTAAQVRVVLNEARRIGTVERIFFEGGEPLLFYPLLVESCSRAREKGFQVGVVTNAYGALTEEDAQLWLRPLAEAGVSYLNISNDTFHYGNKTENPAAVATAVAAELGIETVPIRIEPPRVVEQPPVGEKRGRTDIGGGVMFRGRAVEKLCHGLPVRPWHELLECPYENLESPSRVHVDSFGNVQICQGISMGNMWETPLSDLIGAYRAGDHPICGPLVLGGPAELAKRYAFKHGSGYVDECHLCFLIRKAMIGWFPDCLAPGQVYGPE